MTVIDVADDVAPIFASLAERGVSVEMQSFEARGVVAEAVRQRAERLHDWAQGDRSGSEEEGAAEGIKLADEISALVRAHAELELSTRFDAEALARLLNGAAA